MNGSKSNKKFPSRALKSYAGWLASYTEYDAGHPLLNQTIIKHVMSFLSTTDLLNVRSVCKAWTAPATDTVSKDVMTFFDSEDINDPHVGIQAFIFDMAKAEIPPVRCIHMLDMDLQHPLVVALFHSYGRHIRELRLEEKQEGQPRALPYLRRLSSNKIIMEDLRNVLTFYVPNLEYLEMINVSEALRREETFFAWPETKMTNIVATSENGVDIFGMSDLTRGCFCNLKRLRVKTTSKTPQNWKLIEDLIWASHHLQEIHLSAGVNLTPILNLMEACGRFPALKVFAVSSLTTENLQVLLNHHGHLRLEHFQLKMNVKQWEEVERIRVFRQMIQAFLNLQKDTLKVIRLYEDQEAPFQLDADNFQKMEKLRELKMMPVDCCIPRFLSFAPFLKKLSLSSMKLNNARDFLWDTLFPPSVSKDYLATVADLELPTGLNDANRIISCFVRYFPNVIRLCAKGVDQATVLTTLWKAWPQLESLILELAEDFEDNTDMIFSGITPQLYHSWHFGYSTNNILDDLRNLTSIASLQQLRHLEITISDELAEEDYQYPISRITGYFAFRLMTKLRTLLLPTSKIDEECKKSLINNLMLDRYDFDYIHGGSRLLRM